MTVRHKLIKLPVNGEELRMIRTLPGISDREKIMAALMLAAASYQAVRDGKVTQNGDVVQKPGLLSRLLKREAS